MLKIVLDVQKITSVPLAEMDLFLRMDNVLSVYVMSKIVLIAQKTIIVLHVETDMIQQMELALLLLSNVILKIANLVQVIIFAVNVMMVIIVVLKVNVIYQNNVIRVIAQLVILVIQITAKLVMMVIKMLITHVLKLLETMMFVELTIVKNALVVSQTIALLVMMVMTG